MHPYMTAELVRQHRARLAGEAQQRRLAERVRPGQSHPTRPASRLAAAALHFSRRIGALAT
jgi:hypothetical protein